MRLKRTPGASLSPVSLRRTKTARTSIAFFGTPHPAAPREGRAGRRRSCPGRRIRPVAEVAMARSAHDGLGPGELDARVVSLAEGAVAVAGEDVADRAESHG